MNLFIQNKPKVIQTSKVLKGMHIVSQSQTQPTTGLAYYTRLVVLLLFIVHAEKYHK